MNIQKINNQQSFGLGKLELPSNEFGQRLEKLRPQIMEMGDELMMMNVHDHHGHHTIYVEREVLPFTDNYEGKAESAFFCPQVPDEDIPKTEEGLLSLIKDVILETQTRTIKLYQRSATNAQNQLKQVFSSVFLEKKI